MKKIVKILLSIFLTAIVTSYASAEFTLKERLADKDVSDIDLQGRTQGVSGSVIVDGTKYISNGALLMFPDTEVVFRDGAGLVFVNYAGSGRKAGRLLALGNPSDPIHISAENPGQARGLMLLGRDAVMTQNTNLCTKGFSSECEDRYDYFNYGSLNPTDYRNDSCGILNSVIISGLGIENSNGNALTFAGCGSGTFIQHSTVQNSGSNGVEFIGGDATSIQLRIED